MEMFKDARAVWGQDLPDKWNQFLGFYTEIMVGGEEEEITLSIAARSNYRLYLNGEMTAAGPARAAHGYCRVDRIARKVSGLVRIAVEVAAYDNPEKYSNDCTLEPGLFICEVTDESGRTLTATGDSAWKYLILCSRRPLVELMSHCREIVEWYDLNEDSFNWRMGIGDFRLPIPAEGSVKFLPRHAPYPDYSPLPMETIEQVADVISAEDNDESQTLLTKYAHREYYRIIPDENRFLDRLLGEKDGTFSGKVCLTGRKDGKKTVTIVPGSAAASVTFGRNRSEVGFVDFSIQTDEDCCVDVIGSDHREFTGELKNSTCVARYCLKKGEYHLTGFEPELVRYIKVILRTAGKVTMSYPVLLDDTYPDQHDSFFSCNDGELNAIYEASRRTLRLSTLDIFMDCPGRERGGWLCDSYFSSRGAYQMFGDSSVERDFIENFMLTDGTKKWKGFFPEVYPGSRSNEESVGIQNWSFWLMAELYDYYQRSGDRELIDSYEERVSRFVEGLLSLRGESGLLEGLETQFVDASISNRSFCLYPISIPNNCLAVCILEKMAELYHREDWKKAADGIRSRIVSMDTGPAFLRGKGDGAVWKDAQLRRGDCMTEAGAACELWSGFHLQDKKFVQDFVNTMGYAPKYRSDPNVGKANLFIGTIIRFDVLARLGKITDLVRELKKVYLEELRDGSGTFFEGYADFFGCHGANGVIGSLLTSYVLGLGQLSERTKSVKIAPTPCGLRWARGSEKCSDGIIFMSYRADYEDHVLEMNLQMPEDWHYDLELPFELRGWSVRMNGKEVQGE